MKKNCISQFIAISLLCLVCLSACSMPPATVATPTPPPSPNPLPTFTPSPAEPVISLPDFSLCWVAYSPADYDPDIPRFPLPSELRDDLATLRTAGFQAVITYGSIDVMDEIPALAKESGMQQVILGIWDPADEQEVSDAIAAAAHVNGYLIGNEGLDNDAYSLDELLTVMNRVRSETGKPVATSERLEVYYSEPEMLELGDWLAPIAHPYWHNRVSPEEAVEWTRLQYEDLQSAAPAGRAIQFKELGLPSEGDPNVTEEDQAKYYRLLQEASGAVYFAYFEAFDQHWKAARSELAVEGHWGLFRADRSPKLVVDYVCGKAPPPSPEPDPTATTHPTTEAEPTATAEATVTAEATATGSETTSSVVLSPTTSPPTTRYIFGDSLAKGYELNIDNSSHQVGWLTGGGTLQADFMAAQQWAVVYVTLGPPLQVAQRTQSEDLSNCEALTVDLWANQPNTEVKVGIKDILDPDNGAETLVSRVLTTEPAVYRFPLANFSSAELAKIYLPFEIVYHGSEAATVFIDNIRLECREK